MADILPGSSALREAVEEIHDACSTMLKGPPTYTIMYAVLALHTASQLLRRQEGDLKRLVACASIGECPQGVRDRDWGSLTCELDAARLMCLGGMLETEARVMWSGGVVRGDSDRELLDACMQELRKGSDGAGEEVRHLLLSSPFESRLLNGFC